MCTTIQTNTNLFTNFEKSTISQTNNKKELESKDSSVNNTNIEKDSKPSEIKKGSAINTIDFTETIDPPKNKEHKKSDSERLLKLYGNDVNLKEPNSNSTIEEKKNYKDSVINCSAGFLMSPIVEKNKSGKKKFYLINDIDKSMIKTSKYELKEYYLNNNPVIKFRFNNDMDKNINSIPKLNAKDYGKDKAFFYVNGMITEEDKAKSTGKELEEILGNKVNIIYNPTDGGIIDFVESLGERHNVFIPGITKGMVKGTPFDDITVKTANKFLDQIHNGKELKIVCHSQGGAITSNALEYAKHKLLSEGKSEKEVKNIFSKIEVVTLGAASSPDKFPEGVKIVQISHPKDPVPKVAGGDLSDEKDNIVKYKKHNIETQESKTNTSSTDMFSFIDRFEVAVDNLKKTLGKDNLDSKTRISIGNHEVSGEYQAYLTQKDTRSLLFNFGRQDFQ